MWPFSKSKAPPSTTEASPAAPAAPEPELARLQREVFQRIVDGTPGPGGIDDWRLQVYAGMYEARTHDALIEDVPHTAKLLGPAFLPAVKRYVAAVPGTHYSLARLGHGFSQWLRETPWPASEPALRPDLPDLAALEWARSEAFVADDVAPVEPEAVQQLGPERFTAAWMQFVPSLRLLSLQVPVSELWKAMEGGEAAPAPASPSVERLIVWRKGFEVFHVTVAEDEFAALNAVLKRQTVGEICECFAARGDDAAHAAFQAIGSWLNEGMIGALREPAIPETFGL